MCKSTKKTTQTAAGRTVQSVSPNRAGGSPAPAPGSGGGSGPAVIRRIGEPEHLTAPGLTYIADAPASDPFLTSAVRYHTFFGMAPQRVRTLADVMHRLSQVSGSIQRFRIVTHAHPTNIQLPMFTGWGGGALEDELNDFSQDGFFALERAYPFTPHIDHGNVQPVLNFIQRQTGMPDVLAPFNLATQGATGDLDTFLKYAADRMYLNDRSNPTTYLVMTNQPDRELLNSYINLILDTLRARLVASGYRGRSVTAAALNDLRDRIFSIRPQNDMHRTAGATSIDASDRTIMTRYRAAVNSNFFADKAAAIAKFTPATVLDIRGCRAGASSIYLRAVRSYFGGQLTVTAPRWFQAFFSTHYEEPANNAAIVQLLTTQTQTATAAETNDSFETWAELTRIDTEHEPIWRRLLAAERGKVLRFCKLDWRNQFPQSPISFPGLVALRALNFREALERIRTLFNAPNGSLPTNDAAWGPVVSYVTTSLTPHATALLEDVNAATPDRRTEIFALLRQVNQDLGRSIVPAAVTNNAVTLRQYQEQLTDYIEAGVLAPIRTFMTAVLDRITDPAEPGMYFYMLNIGMPVYILNREETASRTTNGHNVTSGDHFLIVHRDFAQEAFQTWNKMQWEEPIPPAAQAITLSDTTAHRRVNVWSVVLGEQDTGVDRLATCPHPRYIEGIESEPPRPI